MAAARWWRLVPRGPGRSLHSAAQAAVGTPDVTGAEGAAAPVARYPPIVASMTANSKAARQRRVERWQAGVHAAQTVDEKIRILTKMQFKKYVVYPQTFALNADRWYQGFTKTVFLSGLPPPSEPAPPPAQPGSPPVPDLATLRAAALDCLLQEHFYLRRKGRAPVYQQVEAVASPFLDQLVAALMGLLSAHNPVLATAALGSKTADPYCYGHTQFHLLPEKLKRERLLRQNCADQIEVVFRANAMASLFAWTGAQAMYQGFWSEADVTRPFVSQAVITDGKYFSFFCYQLNTLALTAQADQNNSRKNICWGTQSKPLYETIEDNDVKGFNDDVLLQIVNFLLNRPKEDKSPRLEK
ncbi:39S ribosomal protein S30, mitochondrial isoform X3 [Eptesicus fuscus]|uniref:39S ribosomal protein S30, mitochondrial isoform X3 n=1 Tax=Eptesicus fuscus TaxID=29078 RepID=UPI002403A24F|nr:39S ribosomal protein S30, mitochondrial isoform X3 [Eptesicus fuscus]